jgi:LDH2 family malate/lactate/ureidoglycolate dehydrogenase
VLAAVRTDLFVPGDEFRQRMDAILRMLKASPPAPGGGARVLVPGEIELAEESRHREEGVTLAPAIAAQLSSLGEELGIPFPAARPSQPPSEPAAA